MEWEGQHPLGALVIQIERCGAPERRQQRVAGERARRQAQESFCEFKRLRPSSASRPSTKLVWTYGMYFKIKLTCSDTWRTLLIPCWLPVFDLLPKSNHELDRFFSCCKLLILQNRQSRQNPQKHDSGTKSVQNYFSSVAQPKNAREASKQERHRYLLLREAELRTGARSQRVIVTVDTGNAIGCPPRAPDKARDLARGSRNRRPDGHRNRNAGTGSDALLSKYTVS